MSNRDRIMKPAINRTPINDKQIRAVSSRPIVKRNIEEVKTPIIKREQPYMNRPFATPIMKKDDKKDLMINLVKPRINKK